MALLRYQFKSEILGISTEMSVILPHHSIHSSRKAEPYQSMYLLHGYSDDHSAWTRLSSIERYVAGHHIAVIMPQVDHSYYTNMKYGKDYWTFLTKEVPEVAHSFLRLSKAREDTCVAGISMGGYGALKWAFQYPEKFAAVASLSGVTDISHWVAETKKRNDSKFDLIFGEESPNGSEDDLYTLITRLKQSGVAVPRVYQACGTEDFLFENNQRFTEFCSKADLSLTTDFGPGSHEWSYWDHQIQKALKWLPLR